MYPKVLLVGGGITSAFLARLFHIEFDRIYITVWEKLNEFGGRFNSISGGKQNELSVELGAQYISSTNSTINNNFNIFPCLLHNGLIKVMDNQIKGMKQPQCSVTNFVAPFGMKSIVNYFLDKRRCNILNQHKLVALYISEDQWCAVTESGHEEMFDAVILTMPVPEILKLTGNIKSIISDNKSIFTDMKAVTYSSRYALGMFFETGITTEYDSEYIDDDTILRYVSYDTWKRNDSNTFFCAAFHTTIQFGEEYFNCDPEIVKEIILKRVYEKFPNWPKALHVIIHQWNYSQVLNPYRSKPGAITILREPLLIAGGDSFIGSTFDQCLISAKIIVSKVSYIFNKRKSNVQGMQK